MGLWALWPALAGLALWALLAGSGRLIYTGPYWPAWPA